jgi:hypothetical protein
MTVIIPNSVNADNQKNSLQPAVFLDDLVAGAGFEPTTNGL